LWEKTLQNFCRDSPEEETFGGFNEDLHNQAQRWRKRCRKIRETRFIDPFRRYTSSWEEDNGIRKFTGIIEKGEKKYIGHVIEPPG